MSGRGVKRVRGHNNNGNRAGKRRATPGGYINVPMAHRNRANIPVQRNWPVNIRDPVSLNNLANWNGNRAIEVNHPTNAAGAKTYFTPAVFHRLFGNEWKYMPPNSLFPIHPTETHPLTRQPIKRKNVRLVQFVGPRPI